MSPVIILGCIYTGMASPTEAAVISVFYALIVSLFVYKTHDVSERSGRHWWRAVQHLCTDPVYSCSIHCIFKSSDSDAGPTGGQHLDPGRTSTSQVAVLILVINLFLLIVGMVMDTTPAILILTPILLPIVTAVGMNPIHFGIMMVVNLAIGFVTPPIGVNLFVASSLTDIPIMRISKHAMPMIGYFLVALLLITFIPAISLALI